MGGACGQSSLHSFEHYLLDPREEEHLYNLCPSLILAFVYYIKHGVGNGGLLS